MAIEAEMVGGPRCGQTMQLDSAWPYVTFDELPLALGHDPRQSHYTRAARKSQTGRIVYEFDRRSSL